MNKVNEQRKGFTIIEVVLVLAIAALIVLMVFIAAPALQRSQRDTDRKADVGLVISAVSNIMSNNRGNFPQKKEDIQAYVELSGNSDVGSIVIANSGDIKYGNTDSDFGKITVVKSAVCKSVGVEKATTEAGTARQFAVVTYLEANGKGTYYCQNG